MTQLTQDQLPAFSDQVAEICEQMALDEQQMLQAIGSTFIGATMSFGRADYKVEIEGVASASVDTIFESSED